MESGSVRTMTEAASVSKSKAWTLAEAMIHETLVGLDMATTPGRLLRAFCCFKFPAARVSMRRAQLYHRMNELHALLSSSWVGYWKATRTRVVGLAKSRVAYWCHF